MADKQISELTAASNLTDSTLLVVEQGGSAKKANWGMMKNYISPGVASLYSNSSTYAVGDYVLYQDTLYRCTTAITTAEAWTAAHWTAAVLGDDVCDLKRALGYTESLQVLTTDDLEQNGIYAVTGGNSTAANRIKTINQITSKPEMVSVESGFGAYLYAWNASTYIGAWTGSEFVKRSAALEITGTYTLPNYSAYGYDRFKLVIRKSDNTNLVPADGDGAVTLISHSFDKIEEIDNNKARIDALEPEVNDIKDAIDAYTNLADPANLIIGSVWSAVNTVYVSSGYCRQEIGVKPNTTYTVSSIIKAFSWFTNENNEDLGNIEGNVFTTPLNCTKIKLGVNGSNNFVVLEGERPTPAVYDDYPYAKTFSDINDIEKRMDKVEELVSQLTTVSMFETLGAIGDSYTSGGIYGVTGVTGGPHYNVSWPQILARKCGLTATNYSKGAIDVSAWLSDTAIGLPKLLADEAKQLYVITLGINTEKQIADPSQNADVGTTADINLSDPSQNADTFCGHYGRMVSEVINHAPKAKIVLVQPLITSSAKMNAIKNIANLFSLPTFKMDTDDYYRTNFYTDNLVTSHPVSMTYAGMALAFERQINQCIVDNPSYFKDFA